MGSNGAGPVHPQGTLRRAQTVVPVWALVVALLPWLFFGSTFLFAPDTTLLDGEVGRFVWGAWAALSIAIIAVGAGSVLIRRRLGLPQVRARALSGRSAGLWLVVGGFYLLVVAYRTPPTNSGPSSWNDQLAMATWIAHMIDKDAVLSEVRAEPICCRKTEVSTESTLEVRFTFRRPSGADSRITLIDTNPPRLADVKTDSPAGNIVMTSEELARLAEQGRGIAIGPRDALRTVIAHPQAPKIGERDVSITLYLEEALHSSLYSSWYVLCSARLEPGSEAAVSNMTGEPLRLVTFRLDPTTGQVLEVRDPVR
jgi:heme exporter protein D